MLSQFETVLIPRAVADELAAHSDPAARTLIQAAFDEGLIQICGVDDSPVLRMLHAGEAETIALASGA